MHNRLENERDAMRIQQANDNDVAAIRALTRSAYAQWVPILGREPLPMTADYDAAIRAHRFDLLYDGRNLTGLLETVPKGCDLWIENIAVAPSVQGKGYGGRLLRYAESLAKDQNFERLTLFTNKLMQENIAIYERFGFSIDKEVHAPHADIVYMSKPI
jgi:GNAT superfamily N-acetyltransferase